MICTIYFDVMVWNDRMKLNLFHNTVCDFGDNEYDVYVGY